MMDLNSMFLKKINLALVELTLQKIFIKYLQKSTKLFVIFLMTKL